MKLVICVIIDRDLDALLLIEQDPGRGYWFPFDEVKPGETRNLAVQRIANKVNIYLNIRILIISSVYLRSVQRILNNYLSLKFDAVMDYHVYQVYKHIIYSVK